MVKVGLNCDCTEDGYVWPCQTSRLVVWAGSSPWHAVVGPAKLGNPAWAVFQLWPGLSFMVSWFHGFMPPPVAQAKPSGFSRNAINESGDAASFLWLFPLCIFKRLCKAWAPLFCRQDWSWTIAILILPSLDAYFCTSGKSEGPAPLGRRPPLLNEGAERDGVPSAFLGEQGKKYGLYT